MAPIYRGGVEYTPSGIAKVMYGGTLYYEPATVAPGATYPNPNFIGDISFNGNGAGTIPRATFGNFGRLWSLFIYNGAPPEIYDGDLYYVSLRDNISDAFEIRAYDKGTNANIPDLTITLPDNDEGWWGIWSDGTLMYVSGTFANDEVLIYRLDDRSLVGSYNLVMSNDYRDIWSDGTTLWVANGISITTHDLLTGVETTTWPTLTPNGADLVYGLWSDGTTMWAYMSNADILALTLATGARNTAKDLNIGGGANIFSDGVEIWRLANNGSIRKYT